MKSTFRAVLAAVTLCVITGFAVPSQAETLKWQFGNPWPDKHPASKALQQMFADIKEFSGGTLEIKNVSLRSIGFKQGDLLRVLKQGVTEVSLLVPYYVSRDDPMLANTVPAGGLVDAEQNLKTSPIQQAYAKKLLKKNWDAVMVAPFFNRGGRDLIIISRDPINTLDGLKGKKLRHFDKLAMKAMNSIGIPAQIMSQGELYLALKTGVVDAAVHGITNAKAQSIYEVAPHFSEFTPFPGQGAAYGLIMLQSNFDKLTDVQKKAIEKAGQKSWDEGVKLWRDATLTEDARSFMISKGGKDMGPFSPAERKALQKTVLTTWKAECEKLGPEALALYDKLLAVLK